MAMVELQIAQDRYVYPLPGGRQVTAEELKVDIKDRCKILYHQKLRFIPEGGSDPVPGDKAVPDRVKVGGPDSVVKMLELALKTGKHKGLGATSSAPSPVAPQASYKAAAPQRAPAAAPKPLAVPQVRSAPALASRAAPAKATSFPPGLAGFEPWAGTSPASAGGISKGVRVRLDGLVTRSDLNGMTGTVIDVVQNRTPVRWQVRIDHSNETLLLKPENMTAVQQQVQQEQDVQLHWALAESKRVDEETQLAWALEESKRVAATEERARLERQEQLEAERVKAERVEAAAEELRKKQAQPSASRPPARTGLRCADSDDEEGFAWDSDVEGEAAPVQAPPCFDGRWRSRDGTLITIEGVRVDALRPAGRPQHVATLSAWSSDAVTMTLRKAPGRVYRATASPAGDLRWCDGDVWVRGHDATGAKVAFEAGVGTNAKQEEEEIQPLDLLELLPNSEE